MNFLPDMRVTCEDCGGRATTADPRGPLQGQEHRRRAGHDGRGGAGLLRSYPQIERKLEHPARRRPGLSGPGPIAPRRFRRRGPAHQAGGASWAGRPADTLYILDEPTTGLHFADIKKLLDVLDAPGGHGQHGGGDRAQPGHDQERGLVIDLGPEGGDEGGRLVATGTPEEMAAVATSYTGQALKPLLAEACRIRARRSPRVKPRGGGSESARACRRGKVGPERQSPPQGAPASSDGREPVGTQDGKGPSPRRGRREDDGAHLTNHSTISSSARRGVERWLKAEHAGPALQRSSAESPTQPPRPGPRRRWD